MRLALPLLASLLVACATPAAVAPSVPVVDEPAGPSPATVVMPVAPAPPHTGIVAFLKWVAPNAHSVVVRGVGAKMIADDLQRAGIAARIDASTDKCLEGATEDVLITGAEKSPKHALCFKGPKTVISRGRREAEPRWEAFAYEDVRGETDGEAFAIETSTALAATSAFVPTDLNLTPNNDGTWSAFGPLETAADGRPAIRIGAHDLTIALAEPSADLVAAVAKKGAWARVTGRVRIDGATYLGARMTMAPTHVDGVLDSAAFATLERKADAAAAKAAKIIGKSHSSAEETAARDVLVPARDAYAAAFGAPVGRGFFFSAAVHALGSHDDDTVHAFVRATVAGLTAPKQSEKDRALRHTLFLRIYQALELEAGDTDEAVGREAARLIYKIMYESHEPPPYATIQWVIERFPPSDGLDVHDPV